jgi:hypothetical protein
VIGGYFDPFARHVAYIKHKMCIDGLIEDRDCIFNWFYIWKMRWWWIHILFSVNCFSLFLGHGFTYVLLFYLDRHICHHVRMHGEYRFMCCMKNNKSVRRLASFTTIQKGNFVGLFVCEFIFQLYGYLLSISLICFAGSLSQLYC